MQPPDQPEPARPSEQQAIPPAWQPPGRKRRRWPLWLLGIGVLVLLVVVALAGQAPDTPATGESGNRSVAPVDQAPSKSAGAGAGAVLLEASGDGTTTTEKFSSSGNWDLRWRYDCSGFGNEGNFIVSPEGAAFLNPVNQLGRKGSGVEHYHEGGEFYLEVISSCSWSIKAIAK